MESLFEFDLKRSFGKCALVTVFFIEAVSASPCSTYIQTLASPAIVPFGGSEVRSAGQIVDEIFSSKCTVLKALKLNGIAARETHTHHGLTKQLRYGQRRWNGKVIQDKSETQVIQAVKKMREDGISLRKIAEYLDSMGAPPKNRGKKWHPEMMRRILSRNYEP